MADFCNQCKVELGLNQEHDSSDYPDYGPLAEGKGWAVICEGCGYTVIDRKGNCIALEHEIPGINHQKLDIRVAS